MSVIFFSYYSTSLELLSEFTTLTQPTLVLVWIESQRDRSYASFQVILFVIIKSTPHRDQHFTAGGVQDRVNAPPSFVPFFVCVLWFVQGGSLGNLLYLSACQYWVPVMKFFSDIPSQRIGKEGVRLRWWYICPHPLAPLLFFLHFYKHQCSKVSRVLRATHS